MEPGSEVISWRWIRLESTLPLHIEKAMETNPVGVVTKLATQIIKGIERPNFDVVQKFSGAVEKVSLDYTLVARLADAFKSAKIITDCRVNIFRSNQLKHVPNVDGLVESKEEARLVEIFGTLKGNIRLPRLENRNALLRILCRHVKLEDYRLYSIIGRLIDQHMTNLNSFSYCGDHCVIDTLPGEKTPFDDFLENRGEFGRLAFRFLNTDLSNVPRGYNHAGMDFDALPTEEIYGAMLFPALRSKLFAKEGVMSRLQGNLLKAVIQLAEWEIYKDVELIEADLKKNKEKNPSWTSKRCAWLPLFKKLPMLAQKEFLETMSKPSSTAFADYYRQMEVIPLCKAMQKLIDDMYGIVGLMIDHGSDFEKLISLRELTLSGQAFMPTLGPDGRAGTALECDEPPIKYRTFLISKLLRLSSQINAISLWLEPAQAQSVIEILKGLIAEQRRIIAKLESPNPASGELTSSPEEGAAAGAEPAALPLGRVDHNIEWKVNAWTISKAKFEELQKFMQKCPKRGPYNIYASDIDFDEVVEKLYEPCKIPPECNETSLNAIFHARIEEFFPTRIFLEDVATRLKELCSSAEVEASRLPKRQRTDGESEDEDVPTQIEEVDQVSQEGSPMAAASLQYSPTAGLTPPAFDVGGNGDFIDITGVSPEQGGQPYSPTQPPFSPSS